MKKPKPTLKADVLRKFSVNELSKHLAISRAAIQHWGEMVPEWHAATLREKMPHWRRRPDFDADYYRQLAARAAADRAAGIPSKLSLKRAAAKKVARKAARRAAAA